MRKLTQRALTAIAATTTTAALTAVPASAAPATWTVTPGGNITAINTKPLRAVNTDKGVAWVCPGSTAAGDLKSGSGLPGGGIATLTSATFSGCAATGGFQVAMTANNLPWTLNTDSYDSSTGVTSGVLTGFQATMVLGNPASPQCTVTVGAPTNGPGTISATYTNSTSRLALSGSDLKLQTAVGPGCGTLYQPGDSIRIQGEYALISPNGNQVITSP